MRNDSISLVVEHNFIVDLVSLRKMCRLSEHIWTTFFSLLPHSTPYGIPPYHRRGNFQMQDLTHVNMDTDKKPPEGKVERIRQDETLGSWFKITVSLLALGSYL